MPDAVVDASVSIKWANPLEEHADEANQMLDDFETGVLALLAPAFWEYELASGISKAIHRGDLTEDEGREALQKTLALGIPLHPNPGPQQAFELARRYQRSLYDSFYLDLAERESCDFWTADAKLYNAVKDTLPFVRWIADYPNP